MFVSPWKKQRFQCLRDVYSESCLYNVYTRLYNVISMVIQARTSVLRFLKMPGFKIQMFMSKALQWKNNTSLKCNSCNLMQANFYLNLHTLPVSRGSLSLFLNLWLDFSGEAVSTQEDFTYIYEGPSQLTRGDGVSLMHPHLVF